MRSSVCLFSMILLATGPSTEALELKGVGATIGGSWMGQKHEFTEVYEFPSPADDDIAGVVLGAFLSAAMEHQFSACLEALYVRKGFESTSLATDEIGMPVGERTEVYAAHYLSIRAGDSPIRARSERRKTVLFCGRRGGDTHQPRRFRSV